MPTNVDDAAEAPEVVPPAIKGPHPERPAPTEVKSFVTLLTGTVFKFFGDGCSAMAAALSFYTFFSLPALLSLLLTIVGRVMDPAQVQAAIVRQVGRLIGTAGASQVLVILENARHMDGLTLGTLLSLLALAFGATASFSQLQNALNKIWGVKPDPRRNQIGVFLVKRVFSFGVVMTVAFLLLVSLVVTTMLSIVGERVQTLMGLPPVVLEIASSVVSFVVVAVLFAAMFRYLPDARIAWRDVSAGALGSALLFTVGKTVIGLYLGGTDPGTAYGAAGSLAVVLIWVYYTSMVVMLGAEFTEQWAERYGRGIIPERGAVRYEEHERIAHTGPSV